MTEDNIYCIQCEGEIDGDGKWGLCLDCQDKYVKALIRKMKDAEKELKENGVEIKWKQQ